MRGRRTASSVRTSCSQLFQTTTSTRREQILADRACCEPIELIARGTDTTSMSDSARPLTLCCLAPAHFLALRSCAGLVLRWLARSRPARSPEMPRNSPLSTYPNLHRGRCRRLVPLHISTTPATKMSRPRLHARKGIPPRSLTLSPTRTAVKSTHRTSLRTLPIAGQSR